MYIVHRLLDIKYYVYTLRTDKKNVFIVFQIYLISITHNIYIRVLHFKSAELI